MKAWLVGKKDEFVKTVVFAETRGKAKRLALRTDVCEDADFRDLEIIRLPAAEKYYKEGKTELGWNNAQDRRVLVEEVGFRCEYADIGMCETCSAKECCAAYEEYMDADAGGEEP